MVLAAVAAGAQSIDGFPDSRFIEQRETFTPPGGSPVELRFLIAREVQGQSARVVNSTHAAIDMLSQWFGPLPSASLTVAGTPWRGSFSGTSRPGTITVPVRWLSPVRDQSTERALIGAMVRQYWDRAAPSPFDEALINYLATRAIHQLLEGSNFETARFFGGDVPFALRSMLLSPPVGDPRPRVWGFAELAPADGVTGDINHGVRGLQTIERFAGWPTMLQALSRMRTIESGSREALTSILSEISGANMRALVMNCLDESSVYHDALNSMVSEPGPAGLVETTLHITGSNLFAMRDDAGDIEATMPLLIRFADGTEVRDVIDGSKSDQTLVYSAKTPAVFAAIDPDRMLMLDYSRENNVIVRNPPLSKLGVRLALNWMAWLQNAMLSYTASL